MTATLSQPFVLADGTTALTIVPLQIVWNLNANPHGFLVPGSAEMLLNREDYLGLREVGVNWYKLRPNRFNDKSFRIETLMVDGVTFLLLQQANPGESPAEFTAEHVKAAVQEKGLYHEHKDPVILDDGTTINFISFTDPRKLSRPLHKGIFIPATYEECTNEAESQGLLDDGNGYWYNYDLYAHAFIQGWKTGKEPLTFMQVRHSEFLQTEYTPECVDEALRSSWLVPEAPVLFAAGVCTTAKNINNEDITRLLETFPKGFLLLGTEEMIWYEAENLGISYNEGGRYDIKRGELQGSSFMAQTVMVGHRTFALVQGQVSGEEPRVFTEEEMKAAVEWRWPLVHSPQQELLQSPSPPPLPAEDPSPAESVEPPPPSESVEASSKGGTRRPLKRTRSTAGKRVFYKKQGWPGAGRSMPSDSPPF
jgi:hypothetical protein